jgi:hypothetical protein
VVELDASVLRSRRVQAFVALAAAVVAWFVAARHLAYAGEWPSIVIVAAVVMPATLGLIYVALPLWNRRWLFPAAVVLVLVAVGCSQAGWGLPGNFAKLGAATFAGWAFLRLFEELSWVVIVAAIIPFVDAISVWRGPTHSITTHHFEIYTSVAIAFVVPGGYAAYLGPPDVLFYALFLAAALRWNLRPGWTWIATTVVYSLTIVIAYAVHVDGLPALPFLSFGFLVANADLLWRRLRR